MRRSEREQREAEQKARRARRLADRAEERARRKSDNARRAAERAEELARRANPRKGPRDRALEDSIEDYVDEVAEKWSRKAEVWMDAQSSKLFNHDHDRDYDSDVDPEYFDDVDARDKQQATERSRKTREDIRAKSRRNRRHDDSVSDHYAPRDYSSKSDAPGTRSTRSSRRRRKVSAWKKSFRRKVTSNRGPYRDKDQKKVCGVCAGLADYWSIETWQVRFAAVMGLIFIPSLTVPGYFIFYFLMDDKPYYRKASERYEDFHMHDNSDGDKQRKTAGLKSRRNRTRSALSNAQAFSAARQKFADIEARVRLMEAHVTSSKFELQREFRKISGEDA